MYKSSSWRSCTAVVSTHDIFHVFDQFDQSTLAQSMIFMDRDPVADLFLYAEATGLIAVGLLANRETEEFELLQGGVQGRPDTPQSFKGIVAMVLQPLVPLWSQWGWGFQLGDCLVNHIIWADNCHLIAANTSQWEKMFIMFWSELYKHRLALKPGDSTVICAVNTPGWPNKGVGQTLKISIDHLNLHHDVKVSDHLKTLGVSLDCQGNTDTSLQWRVLQAEAPYRRVRTKLRNRGAPPIERVRGLQRTAGTSFLFGAMGWTPTRKRILQVRAWKRTKFRDVSHCRFRTNENFTSYKRRTAAVFDTFYKRHELEALHIRWLRSYFNWAISLATKTWATNRQHMLFRLLTERDQRWWDFANPALQARPGKEEEWRHQCPGVQRIAWEDLLCRVVGHDWKTQLQETKPAPAIVLEFCRITLDHYKVHHHLSPTSSLEKPLFKDPRKALQALAEIAEHVDLFDTLSTSREWGRIALDRIMHWPNCLSFDIITDNQSVSNWFSGSAAFGAADVVRASLRMLEVALVRRRPRSRITPLVSWTPRSLTGTADLICNSCMDAQTDMFHITSVGSAFGGNLSKINKIRCIGDGAYRKSPNLSVFSIVKLGIVQGQATILGWWGF